MCLPALPQGEGAQSAGRVRVIGAEMLSDFIDYIDANVNVNSSAPNNK
ncbi:hypothetical protein GCM10010970_40420 [Silvimonas iriomotensis]|uniref:Uncharacterized protein n=1 Tax=Silvimonas iriomotensis TaxID=449662 RepID=A0ABQ2PEQ6_9NEIS|nr:hypothetical protein GCM10010970_40420 [Silvimonas iriomotensis]